MEWLSHSQKKHCELCKTPFRFTKLYAPNMPKTVPFYVMVSHITKYIFRNILAWARAALVLMVWLVWLPYLMRRVWSALFWLSDEGLGPIFGRPDTVTTLSSASGLTPGSDTCAATTSANVLQTASTQLPSSASTSQTTASLYGINITTENPLSSILLNMFLGNFYMGGPFSRANSSVAEQSLADPIPAQQPTLLSEVKFLQKLSSASPTLGGFAVDVLEGQIITVLVVICFILIILVRDYVVQQQPDINMRAAFAAAGIAGLDDDGDVVMADAPAADPADHGDHGDHGDHIEPLRLDDADFGRGPERGDENVDMPEADREAGQENETSRPEAGPSGHNETEGGPAEKYVRLYREAQGDPDRIRQLAHQRNQEEELAFFLNIGDGKVKASRNEVDMSVEEGESSDQTHPTTEWGWPEDLPLDSSKGKAPMNDDWGASGEQNHASRPRSATDGPQRSGGINPLGHNNWSFSDPSREGQLASSQSSADWDAPAADPLPDQAASATGWPYLTPPSSTLAESASSSVHGPTPSSSDDYEFASNSAGPLHHDALDVADEPAEADDWEAIADLDARLELQQNTGAVAEDGVARQQPRPDGLAQRVADFMWRDVDAIPPHELPPLPDAADDFLDHDQDLALGMLDDPLQQAQGRDQEVIAAAAAAGIDAEAEAIEDAEDLEGILELLGMRGPIAGLFQNALFCAFLVSITLFLGVFVPYNLGRIAIWISANPIRPVRIIFGFSKTVQDMAMVIVGLASTLVFGCLNGILSLLRPEAPQLEIIVSLVHRSWSVMENAALRLRDSGVADFSFASADEIRNFSIVSHEALLTLKGQVALLFATVVKVIFFIFGGSYVTKLADTVSWTTTASSYLWQVLKDLPALVSIPSSWVIDLGSSETTVPLNPELISWSAMDRVWAILGGYVAMCLTAALYLGHVAPIAGRLGRDWEATLVDVLNQASGVMKVILIIGIEMLIFPLYCGLLLDVALLPLFEDTTIMSRVMFTVNYPLTSIFVHWFVGTGYMFHFALFVSMCRKIMRKGVLCKS